MQSLISKLFIAGFGVALALTPLTASAAQVGIGVNIGGPGYAVHAGYVNPGGPCYGCWRRPAPRPPRYAWHRYGWAPGGYQGYYWRGRWFAHRRWGNGVWIYF
jgi:hypothetical protein